MAIDLRRDLVATIKISNAIINILAINPKQRINRLRNLPLNPILKRVSLALNQTTKISSVVPITTIKRAVKKVDLAAF